MSIDVRPYGELDPSELEEWERLASKAHPPGEARLGSDLSWADLDADTDFLVRLRDDGGELRACAWVTRRSVRVGGRTIVVAGVRGVLTDPDRRRRGYGRAVMLRAHTLMQSFAECELALLFSSVMAVPFYEALGWRTIEGPVTCEQPRGRIDYTATLPLAPIMVLPLRPDADLPSGAVEIDGLPW
jgi:aminoglycoside 2'-N-acetyltransferase I